MSLVKVGGKMLEPGKCRLVRCPECRALLPKPIDYNSFQCGGCGSVLTAAEKVVVGLDDEARAITDQLIRGSKNLRGQENLSFNKVGGKRHEPGNFRLVRCPKCKSFLPEPMDCDNFQCGCCGCFLKAAKEVVVGFDDEEKAMTDQFIKESKKLGGKKKSFARVGGKMLEPGKFRLVLCFQCHALLPEPTDFYFYQCGGCGSLLKGAKEIVVGFDDEAQAITDQLIRGSMELDVISIVGMPGIGKTTLAKVVYKNFSVMHHFHSRAWSSVSQVCCKKDVLLSILGDIAPENSEQDYEKNEDALAEKLYRCLKGKRYLIVLDDVWDVHAWSVLESSFPNDANGSRILLTGRCHLLNKKPYPLRRLTDDECWELLQKKLAYKVDISTSLPDVGRRIAKSCRGLPLTVVLTAGILANLDRVSWEGVANSLSSNILRETKECMNILELSYMHLPDYLKPCFLYFAAFPEDQEISIKRLMWLWIAEGFVQENEPKVVEDIAEDYVMALISRNLVMVAKQSSIGKIRTCRIHDLLIEFCRVKSKEENFLQLITGHDGETEKGENQCRLCIHSQVEHFVRVRPLCPKICTLMFFSQGAGIIETPHSLSFLFRLKLLRVLDLGQIDIGAVFPGEIAMLVQLRYLAVLGGMNGIPSSIDSLSNLETLVLMINAKGLDVFLLPNTLWNMDKLRHVNVHGCLIDLSLAKDELDSSSRLDSLVSFSTPKLYLNQNIESIMRKFPNISKLKCSLSDCERFIEDGDKIVVDFPSQLESLKLIFCNVNVLQSEFNFPSNLKKLTLVGFSWSMISSLGKLPNLEVLKILNRSIDGVDKWEMEEEEFPNLKFLKLGHSDIVRWTGSGDHFPALRILELEGCKDLEELPSCLGTMSTLDMIKVHKCPNTLTFLVQGIGEEQKYWGNEDLRIVISEEVEKI